jgi:tetratricopeptide (TPR) repeat protein
MNTPTPPADDLPNDAFAIGAQAHIALEEGRLDDAATLYQWVLRLARADEDQDTEAAALHQLGIVASHLGQPGQAAAYYRQSLAIKQELGNRAGQSATLHELGRLALERGDLDGATDALNESLDIARGSGDPVSLILTLDLRGQLARITGDPEAARAYYEEALTLAVQLGRSDLAAPAAASLGDLAVQAANPSLARQRYEISRTYYRAARDREGELAAELSLGGLAARAGDFDTARTHYETVVDGAAQHDEAAWAAPAAARALHGLGSLANRQGDYAAALDYAQRSLRIARALDDRRLGGTLLASIGMSIMNAAAGGTDRVAFTRQVVRGFRAWTAALARLDPVDAPEATPYREWIRQAGPVYQQVAASGALNGALAEWWPDA